MPIVPIVAEDFMERMGCRYTEESLQDLCFSFGIELDDVSTETEKQADGSEIEKTIYKFDVPANRYDLLCLEGLTNSLRIFLGKLELPVLASTRFPDPQNYTLAFPTPKLVMRVKSSCKQIRPFIVCAVLRNVHLSDKTFRNFLDLQDKLHFNICRQRSLVAIGTHNLDSLTPPFVYSADRPEDIRFVALNQTKEMNAKEVLDLYRDPANVDGRYLRPYTDLIYDSPVYPVVRDSKGVILSLPPVINGNHSKMDGHTNNIFIECTCKDRTRGNIVLNQMVTAFEQYRVPRYGVPQECIEPVEVIYEDDNGVPVPTETRITPELSPKHLTMTIADVRSKIGRLVGDHVLDGAEIVSLLKKMQISSTVKGDLLEVSIPPTRGDVMHPCDITEDVAIAWGYNNIVKTSLPTGGQQLSINKLSDLLRREITGAGFSEILTLSLCSRDEAFDNLGHKDNGNTAVVLSNPKTLEFQIVRPTLLPGLLKTIRENKALKLKDGLKLFEVSDVVLKDENTVCGSRNERRFIAGYAGLTAGFEIIHGLVDYVMRLLDVSAEYCFRQGAPSPPPPRRRKSKDTYQLVPTPDAMYFPGRSAVLQLHRSGKSINLGTMGIIHPDVLAKFDINTPVSVVEIALGPFL